MIIIKTENLFLDLEKRNNICLYKETKNNIVYEFEKKYNKFRDKFFYEQFMNSGGFSIDNWIRIYGCGEINIIEKNNLYNKDNILDILIGEDVLGGLFAIKEDYVYYFAPDTNRWENLEIYYTQFLDWILNNTQGTNNFYKLFRWNTWKEDCKNIKLNEGFSFYPLLQADYDIEKRSRKIILIDELIRFNLQI